MELGRVLRVAPFVVVLLTLSLLAPAARAGVSQQLEEPLTNASVIKLVRAGFGEKTVISIIGVRPARFDLSPDKLIELKKRGVSEKVILAMLSRDAGNSSFADNDWGDDDVFFGGKNGATGGGTGSPATGVPQEPGETNIFGSSGGSKGRTRSRSGGASGENDTQTLGSASVRIVRPPAEAGGAPPRLERTPMLTNESIVEMVNAGFSEGTIIRRIEQSPAEFDLAPAKLQELRRRRVAEPVIEAMRAAMSDDAPQTSKTRGRTGQ